VRADVREHYADGGDLEASELTVTERNRIYRSYEEPGHDEGVHCGGDASG
jgi:hypothetical protein